MNPLEVQGLGAGASVWQWVAPEIDTRLEIWMAVPWVHHPSSSAEVGSMQKSLKDSHHLISPKPPPAPHEFPSCSH